MFRRRPTSMNNERYLPVNNDEREEHAADTEDLSFTWRPKPKFKPLAQEEVLEDESDEIDDDDRTTPTDNRETPLSRTNSEVWDEEEDLQRYQLDFSNTSMEQRLRASTTLDDSIQQGQITIRMLYKVFCETQAETRRLRLEKLLSASTDRDKFWINLYSWCDIYDRGAMLLVSITGLWLLIATLLHQIVWSVLAVLFFCARISAKPIYWYMWGRHIARKRKVTIEIYEELNQMGTEATANNTADSTVEIV